MTEQRYPKTIMLNLKAVDDCVLVHDAVHRKVHVLNKSAAAILALCNGERSVEEITTKIAADTHLSQEEIAADVTAMLQQFTELEILEPFGLVSASQ